MFKVLSIVSTTNLSYITFSFKINLRRVLDSANCFTWSLIVFICFFLWSSIVFACFYKAFSNREYRDLACSVILLWSDGSISLPVKYSCVSIFPDLLFFYCFSVNTILCFSSLVLSSVAVISFYILSKKILSEMWRIIWWKSSINN